MSEPNYGGLDAEREALELPPHEPDYGRTGHPARWCERCRIEQSAAHIIKTQNVLNGRFDVMYVGESADRLARAYLALRAEVESLTARLAAQSGYAENEEQADVQAALIAQYDAIVAAVWNVRPMDEDPVDGENDLMYDSAYNGARHDILEAITHHDPRKGAE